MLVCSNGIRFNAEHVCPRPYGTFINLFKSNVKDYLMKILRDVLREIEPTQKEADEIKKLAASLIKLLKEYEKKRKILLAGSVAKGTYLRDSADVDIFIMFKERLPKEEMKREIEELMAKAFPGTVYQMNYAEHPYIRFHISGRRVDMVPAYEMKKTEERLTAVDRSVLHTKYILKNLKKSKREDVLLLKQLLKANGLYGAEIKIQGFSGYLCELLIIKYGSFSKLIKEAAGWKLPLIIDLKKYYKPKDAELLIKKFNSKFVVIDPTDKNRNVAAALSEENFKKFVSLARRFLRKPSKNLFFREESFDEKIKRASKHGKIILIKFKKPDVVDDVLWGQLKKFMRMLEDALADFVIRGIIADANREVRVAVIAKNDVAGGVVEKQGPPIKMKKHVESFRRAHKNDKIIKRGGRLIALVKTPKKKLRDAVLEFIKENYEKFSHLPLKEASAELL